MNWVLRARRSDKSQHRPRHVFVTQNGDWMVRGLNWEFRHFGCDGLVCVNAEHYERHCARYPSVLIPNGVDATVFSPGPGRREALGLAQAGKVVLMVSALIASKHVLEGIEAVAGLPEAQLVVAGDGELRREVDELGRRRLGKRFRRVVWPRNRMVELYRCADVFLHMSQEEPFGNVYLEALACGLGVVAHDTPTTRWMLEDAAFVVDTTNICAVRGALQKAWDCRDQAEIEYRRRLIQRRFSWEALARQYGEFLVRICRT